ncbi:MAG: hypothetical protein JXA28_06555 [Bacteroidetes bacterium]|nr:hypothetical protein [Bacteroidota bacterium]
MAASSQRSTGFIAFILIFAGVIVASVSLQEFVVKTTVSAVFPNYVVYTDILPSEWIIMSRDLSEGESFGRQRERLNDIFFAIRSGEYDSQDRTMNELRGKRALKEHVLQTEQTLYFVNPYFAFLPLHVFLAGLVSFLLSMFLPGANLAWIRDKLLREYERVGSLLEKQFDAHDVDFHAILAAERDRREQMLRYTTLPQVVVSEVEDYSGLRRWVNGETANPFIPIAFFFRYRISASYGNVIQGLVSGGAAILIFVIGLRGLKLIPAEEPSLILMALSIEFILLIVLMVTFAGSAQEERLDRVVKELEAEQRDAIKHQTEVLHEVLGPGGGSGGRSGITTGDSISEFEEQRLLDEVLSLMLKEAERKRSM